MKTEEIKQLFADKIKDRYNTHSIFDTKEYVLLDDAISIVENLLHSITDQKGEREKICLNCNNFRKCIGQLKISDGQNLACIEYTQKICINCELFARCIKKSSITHKNPTCKDYLNTQPEQSKEDKKEEKPDTQVCKECGSRMALITGHFIYDVDDEPYINGVIEDSEVDSGDCWLGGYKCDNCDNVQGFWTE